MAAYVDRAGYMLDCFLCALFGGPEDTPISLEAARAQVARRRWGCVLCWWLSQTVERDHCANQLAGRAVKRWAALRAGLQLAVVFVVLFYGVPALLGRL